MSTNKTPNLTMHSWAGADSVKRLEFNENFTKIDTEIVKKYVKPVAGIPKTDLVTAVQTSLGKADGSIQTTSKGVVNGVASLGADGKVPAAQLPPSNATATAISVSDSGDFYTGGNVELVLQEIGQVLNAMRGNLIVSTNGVLGS